MRSIEPVFDVYRAVRPLQQWPNGPVGAGEITSPIAAVEVPMSILVAVQTPRAAVPTARPTAPPSRSEMPTGHAAPSGVWVDGAVPEGTPLRLTRRGRLVIRLGGVLLALAAVLAGVLAGGGVASGSDRASPLPVVHHVVTPGETLWDIAGQVAPEADPRDAVLRIIEANGLADANVRAGTRLVIPLSS